MKNNFNYVNVCHPVCLDYQPFLDYETELETFATKFEQLLYGFVKYIKWYEYATKYPRRQLGFVEIERKGRVYATIYITINTGKYDGACLDYIVIYNSDIQISGSKQFEKQLDFKIRSIKIILNKIAPEHVDKRHNIKKITYQSKKQSYVRTIQRVCPNPSR